MQMTRLNIGCGMTPTEGWRNIDNSPSIRIAKWGPLGSALHKPKLIGRASLDKTRFCQSNNIELADATRHIPADSETVEVIYTSHMLEHLDRDQAGSFMNEARRVLKKNKAPFGLPSRTSGPWSSDIN